MTNTLRVAIEIGPRGKKVVAVAPDWPGLSRGAKTEEAAIARLRDYLPRYLPVAALANTAEEFAAQTEVHVVERYPGTGSTDFWGISFAFSAHDLQPMSEAERERELMLMGACWTFFDEVRDRVSAELRKGPRGGGRDRDQIVRHTLGTEQEWSRQIGLPIPDPVITAGDALAAQRDAYRDAIRTYHAAGKTAGKSPLRFLIRHTAFHTMDHAWEMEDKDLTCAQ